MTAKDGESRPGHGPGALTTRVAIGIAVTGWVALAFWTFSYSFSSSFFRYNPHSRLPPFAAAVFAATIIPVSVFLHWRRFRLTRTGAIRAWLDHVISAIAALLPFVIVAAFLARAEEPWRLSADDAMGVGIDFMILVATALGSAIVLAAVLVITRIRMRPGDTRLER